MPNTNCLEGMRCPKCKQEDTLHIIASVTLEVTDDGSEAIGDQEWDDTNPCHCPECKYKGTVGEFRE